LSIPLLYSKRLHDTQHNDTQHYGIKHNYTQHKWLIYGTRHTWHSVWLTLSMTILYHYAEYHCAACRILFVILGVIMLSVSKLSVFMLNVVILSVVAPSRTVILWLVLRNKLACLLIWDTSSPACIFSDKAGAYPSRVKSQCYTLRIECYISLKNTLAYSQTKQVLILESSYELEYLHLGQSLPLSHSWGLYYKTLQICNLRKNNR
jgi:hypothetical protein